MDTLVDERVMQEPMDPVDTAVCEQQKGNQTECDVAPAICKRFDQRCDGSKHGQTRGRLGGGSGGSSSGSGSCGIVSCCCGDSSRDGLLDNRRRWVEDDFADQGILAMDMGVDFAPTTNF